MGLFKKRDDCVDWLKKVDKVYVAALRQNNARGLEPYFSRKCLGRLVEVVNSNTDNLCGLERYREVTYTLKSKSENMLVYLKNADYKNVNMGYGVVVPVGEATSELWYVEHNGNEYKVVDIKGV